MLDPTHPSQFGIDFVIAEISPERLPSLGERVLDLLEGEFAGVIRTHSRGEVYGGC